MESSRDTGIDPDTVRGWSDLTAVLEARPETATPALVRRLKERVEALYRTDAQAADALADCVFRLAEQCADAESMALGHRAKGLAALAVGSSREAIAHYEAAERLYRQLGNEIERARVLRSMIDALMHLGRYDEALAAGRQAQEIFQRRGLRALAAQVETNVGNVYYRMDRNAESLEAQNRALRIFRELEDHEAVAVTEFNRANIFSNLNDLAEAERGYRRALRFFRERGFRVREAQCLYKLAYLAYLRFRYSEALALFERVRALELSSATGSGRRSARSARPSSCSRSTAGRRRRRRGPTRKGRWRSWDSSTRQRRRPCSAGWPRSTCGTSSRPRHSSRRRAGASAKAATRSSRASPTSIARSSPCCASSRRWRWASRAERPACSRARVCTPKKPRRESSPPAR
ncbi:MAG TPA: tetratricopeptide repeat protein [Gemmatimonadota bacterium]|jgi:tetratricopeptide (TPR) repeat protein